MTQPLVSVIAICYNHQDFLKECLESIRQQTYPYIQLIILDDCSTDSSVSLIQQWMREHASQAVFIPHQKNQGICRTLNEGLKWVQGKYVSIISTDDKWLLDKIERQVEKMETLSEEVGVLYSDAYRIDRDGQPMMPLFIEWAREGVGQPEGNIFSILLDGNFIPAPSVLIRRACYDKVGGYDERLSYEDWDMWLRIAVHFQFAYSPHIATQYRSLSNSLSHALFARPTRRGLLSTFLILSKHLNSKLVSSTQREKIIEQLFHLKDFRFISYFLRVFVSCPLLLFEWFRIKLSKRFQRLFRF
jgi:glycosyltransferase involved in cell wall biosynthesis